MISSRHPVTGVSRVPATLAMLLAAAMFLFAGVALANGPDPNRFIVQFAERGNSDAARHAIARAGGQVLLEMPAVNAVAARIPFHALQGLRNNPNIQLIEQDAPRFPMAQVVPYGISMVQADQVAAVGGNVMVCVIDSGIDAGHEDLKHANLTGTDVAKSGGGMNYWDTDTCGHGTHVAGTIIAQNNSIGVVGVAPHLRLHSVKVFDGEECDWTYASRTVNAAYECKDEAAKTGAKLVINMSLGCVDSGRGGPFGCANSTDNNGFQDLYDNFGVLSIASAGNAGTTQKSYPASYASVVSVAAIDEDKVVADFSQKNDAVELSGPGVGVLSTVPQGMGRSASVTANHEQYLAEGMDGSPAETVGVLDIVDCGLGKVSCTAAKDKICLVQRGDISFADKVLNCQGGGGKAAIIYNNEPGPLNGTLGGVTTTIPSVGITQLDGQTILGLPSRSGRVVVQATNYASYSGTSMASPHVAGVAALVWSHHTSLTNAQIRSALQSTAERLGGTAGKNNAYGYGLVQAEAALGALGGGGESPPPPPPPEPGGITLAVNAYKVKGVQHATLSWDGTTASHVDIYRDGAKRTVLNSGTYTDNIGNKGGGSYVYQVCEAGSVLTCSPEVTAAF